MSEEVEIKIDKDFLIRAWVLTLFRKRNVISSEEFRKYVNAFCKKFNIRESEFYAYTIDIISYTTAHKEVVLTDRGRKLLELMNIRKLLKTHGVDQFEYSMYL